MAYPGPGLVKVLPVFRGLAAVGSLRTRVYLERLDAVTAGAGSAGAPSHGALTAWG
jgi:hypothetical protein